MSGLARRRVQEAPACEPLLLVGRAKYPGKDELRDNGERNSRQQRQGRGSETQTKDLWAQSSKIKKDEQLTLV